MTDGVDDRKDRSQSNRVETALRAVLIVLVAAVIGLSALFGYTVWQTRKAEETATPAARALVGLREFVRANPNNAAGRVRYGEALAAAGQFPESIVQFKAAVKLDPKHTGAWLDMGLVAMQTDQRKAAEGYFTKVVELTEGAQYENINQRREQALFHMGEIALDERRYEDAAGYFKAALRIRRDASDTYYLLAASLHGLGDDNAALEQLEAATAFDPNYAEAHYLWGQILLEKKDLINAAVHLRLATELAPDAKEAAEAFAELGTVDEAIDRSDEALAQKRTQAAVDAALLARQIDPTSVDAVLAHARALIALGDEDKAAKTTLEEALELDADNAEAKQLLASLDN